MFSFFQRLLVVAVLSNGSVFANASDHTDTTVVDERGTAVVSNSVSDVTYTYSLFTCSCEREFSCSDGKGISAIARLRPTGVRYQTANEGAVKNACAANLKQQTTSGCVGHGTPILGPITYSCTFEQKVTTQLPPTPKQISFVAPDGLIWGPVARHGNDRVKTMTQAAAKDYCKDIGQRLPTKAELETLSKQLGSPKNYDSSPVPDLGTYYSWSSSTTDATRFSNEGRWAISGLSGLVVSVTLDTGYESARCVSYTPEARQALVRNQLAVARACHRSNPQRCNTCVENRLGPGATEALNACRILNAPSR